MGFLKSVKKLACFVIPGATEKYKLLQHNAEIEDDREPIIELEPVKPKKNKKRVERAAFDECTSLDKPISSASDDQRAAATNLPLSSKQRSKGFKKAFKKIKKKGTSKTKRQDKIPTNDNYMSSVDSVFPTKPRRRLLQRKRATPNSRRRSVGSSIEDDCTSVGSSISIAKTWQHSPESGFEDLTQHNRSDVNLDATTSQPVVQTSQPVPHSIECLHRSQSHSSLMNGTRGYKEAVIQASTTRTCTIQDVHGRTTLHTCKSTATIYSHQEDCDKTTAFYLQHEFTAPDQLQSLNIVKIGNQTWVSQDNHRSFQELLVQVLSYQGNQLVISHAGGTLWCTQDNRRFEEIKSPFPSVGGDSKPAYPVPPAISPKEDGSGITEINGLVNNRLPAESLNKISPQNTIQHPTDGALQTKSGKSTAHGPLSPCNGGTDTDDEELSSSEHVRESTPVSPEMEKASKLRLTPVSTNPKDRNLFSYESSLPAECPIALDPQLIEQLDVSEQKSCQLKPKDYDLLIDSIRLLFENAEEDVVPLYCPVPGDCHRVLITGVGLKRFEPDIKRLERNFPGYTLTVSELESGADGLPLLTDPLSDGLIMPCYLHMGVDSENSHVATVGAFVKDKNSVRKKVMMGITAAHAIMTAAEQISIRCSRSSAEVKDKTRDVAEKVIGRINLNGHLKIAPHNHSATEVRDSPFIACCEWVPAQMEGIEDHLMAFQRFASDIALLPVDPDSLDNRVLAQSPIRSSIQTHTGPVSIEKPEKPGKQTRIAGYIDIRSPSDIEMLRRRDVRIFIEGTTGRLVEAPRSFNRGTRNNMAGPPSSQSSRTPLGRQPNMMIAPHIAFTVKNALIHGNSGSLVMVYNVKKDELYIIGLLKGSLRGMKDCCEDVIYQAIPLAPALKQLEILYPDHLTELRLAAGGLTGGLSTDLSLPYLSHCQDSGYHGGMATLSLEE